MTSSATSQSLDDPYGILAALQAEQPGYAPEWVYPTRGAGAALVAIVANQLGTIRRRLDQAPQNAALTLLDLLGIELTPAQEAQAVLVFVMENGAADAQLGQGTRVAASGGPTGQIVFETQNAAGLTSAKLIQVASFWPGQDKWIDHSTAVAAGQAFVPFQSALLQYTPHALYLGHDTLLALAGKCAVQVTIDLTTPGNQPLPLDWQYYDGGIWRSFLSDLCNKMSSAMDSTEGFQSSGRISLTAGWAQSVPVAVNGITTNWIRAVLTNPLLPDPARILPQVNAIKLGLQIVKPLTIIPGKPTIKPLSDPAAAPQLTVRAMTQGGAPLENVTFSWTDPANAMVGATKSTDSSGQADFGDLLGLGADPIINILWADAGVQTTVRGIQNATDYDVTFKMDGLKADAAYADQLALDLTKTFYPFGLAPQAGAAFYFKCDEVFSKPSANVQVLVAKAQTAQDQSMSATAVARSSAAAVASSLTAIDHLVVWEYYNGTDWVAILYSNTESDKNTPYADLDNTEVINLTVPLDIQPTQVNNNTGLWVRARVVSGGFGLKGTLPSTSGGPPIPLLLPRAPALADFRLGYTRLEGPLPPQHTLTYNDFQYQDQTNAILWPGSPFPPFLTSQDITPALYLGFSKALPPDSYLGFDFDIQQQIGDTQGPALVWEYWNGFLWQDLEAMDGTSNLAAPGIVSFIGPVDSQTLARFGTALYWVRARLREDGPPATPTINSISANAVLALQQDTIVNEPMGASTGQSNQVFSFNQVPVLGDPEIEVEELVSPLANFEWRVLAQQLTGDLSLVEDLEAQLAAEGSQTDLYAGDLHLVRDRTKQVIAAWVRWHKQPTLFLSGPNDRDYVVDAAQGKLYFGGNGLGMAPPSGAAIMAVQYVIGGGEVGNVAAGAINSLQGAVGGLASVSNPRAASGGANGETLAELQARGPKTLRHRGRGLTSADYEALAYEASPDVAVAYAQPIRAADGTITPGWVTIVLIPRVTDAIDFPQPQPTAGLCADVLSYISERAPADVVAAGQIYIIGPTYQAIDVNATIVPLDVTQAGEVTQAATTALEEFLHPLLGGPSGSGWPPGRPVHLSDVAVALRAVEGVDYVRELALLQDGVPHGESVDVPAGRMVAAGTIQITIVPGKQNS